MYAAGLKPYGVGIGAAIRRATASTHAGVGETPASETVRKSITLRMPSAANSAQPASLNVFSCEPRYRRSHVTEPLGVGTPPRSREFRTSLASIHSEVPQRAVA